MALTLEVLWGVLGALVAGGALAAVVGMVPRAERSSSLFREPVERVTVPNRAVHSR